MFFNCNGASPFQITFSKKVQDEDKPKSTKKKRKER